MPYDLDRAHTKHVTVVERPLKQRDQIALASRVLRVGRTQCPVTPRERHTALEHHLVLCAFAYGYPALVSVVIIVDLCGLAHVQQSVVVLFLLLVVVEVVNAKEAAILVPWEHCR